MASTIQLAQEYFMNTYASFPLVFTHGEGCRLYDEQGRSFLDFTAGIAVNALGYAHPRLTATLQEQVQKLLHVSNLYYNTKAPQAAARLAQGAEMDRVFFCNSGAEAVEAALKLARLVAKRNKGTEAFKIISMNNSFHGRTFGALSTTGQRKYQEKFDPLLPEVQFVAFNDTQALQQAINEQTAAVILEPIQGEGGIQPADAQYLKEVRELCTKNQVVLIFDEVQSGIGRSGHFFAYQYYGVRPDIVATAKGLGGGVPIGAILAPNEIAQDFVPGTHATTFGGGALACTAATVVIEELLDHGLLLAVKEMGEYLRQGLLKLQERHPDKIEEIRGLGLMQGMVLHVPPGHVVKSAMDRGLLVVGAGNNVVRFVPPLIVQKGDIDACLEIMDQILEEMA